MAPLDRTVLELLSGYRPCGAVEVDDVGQIVALARESEDPWSQVIPLHLTASALVVHPSTGRVLLRWHARQQAWLQIGGHGDPGESVPIDVALREGREETGLADLTPWPDASLVHVAIVRVSSRPRSPDRAASPAHQHADLRFVLATDDPDGIAAESEDAPLQWLSIDDAGKATSEANLRETLDRVGRLLSAQ